MVPSNLTVLPRNNVNNDNNNFHDNSNMTLIGYHDNVIMLS
jgi:hypothetical protein